jgi:hypothetical protein
VYGSFEGVYDKQDAAETSVLERAKPIAVEVRKCMMGCLCLVIHEDRRCETHGLFMYSHSDMTWVEHPVIWYTTFADLGPVSLVHQPVQGRLESYILGLGLGEHAWSRIAAVTSSVPR